MTNLDSGPSVVVTCPDCKFERYEQLRGNDKDAWKCDKCGTVWEDGKPHLLSKIATFNKGQRRYCSWETPNERG